MVTIWNVFRMNHFGDKFLVFTGGELWSLHIIRGTLFGSEMRVVKFHKHIKFLFTSNLFNMRVAQSRHDSHEAIKWFNYHKRNIYQMRKVICKM